MRSLGADGVTSRLALVTAEIVEDDEFALGEGRCQHLFDIESEEFAIDRTVDDPWRADPVVAQRRDEGHGLPMAERRGCLETLPRRPQPRSGAMLVLIQVSSIKIRREASI